MTNPDQLPIPILNTPRLTLRPLQISDDQQILALRSDKNVNKYLGRESSVSIDDSRKFIKTILENQSLYWAVTLTDVNKLMGTICLFNLSDDHRKAEIGYELLPENQGNGLMHEALLEVIAFAFKRLNLTLIEAYTHRDNQSSIKLLEKLNFKQRDAEDGEMILFALIKQSL